jgi:hypothetical protein
LVEKGVVCSMPHAPAVTIVTDGWPAALIASRALKLHVRAAYFPGRIHEAFNPSNFRLLEWKYPSAFDYRDLHGTTPIEPPGCSGSVDVKRGEVGRGKARDGRAEEGPSFGVRRGRKLATGPPKNGAEFWGLRPKNRTQGGRPSKKKGPLETHTIL